MMLPTGRPVFTGRTVTVTSSPALKLLLVHPRFCMSGGLLASTTQCTSCPLSPLTSNCRNVCGFAQIHSVTMPFSTRRLAGSFSNAAAPWCAATGRDAIRRPATTAKSVTNVFLIATSTQRPEIRSEDKLRAQLDMPHRPDEIGDGARGRIRHTGHEACGGRGRALRPSEGRVVVIPVIEHVEGFQPQFELGGCTDLRALLQ